MLLLRQQTQENDVAISRISDHSINTRWSNEFAQVFPLVSHNNKSDHLTMLLLMVVVLVAGAGGGVLFSHAIGWASRLVDEEQQGHQHAEQEYQEQLRQARYTQANGAVLKSTTRSEKLAMTVQSKSRSQSACAHHNFDVATVRLRKHLRGGRVLEPEDGCMKRNSHLTTTLRRLSPSSFQRKRDLRYFGLRLREASGNHVQFRVELVDDELLLRELHADVFAHVAEEADAVPQLRQACILLRHDLLHLREQCEV